MTRVVDLGNLGIDHGGHLLVKNAMSRIQPGDTLEVVGQDPALPVHLAAWARTQGHIFEGPGRVTRQGSATGRWRGAHRSGAANAAQEGSVVENPAGEWGLASRGARVELGSPKFDFPLSDKRVVWAEEAPRLYAQAVAAQWDPATAIPWTAPINHPPQVEDAVVQVMTYLVENETLALLVPARFLAKIHPHFREVMQLLAIQTADEARHIEVFSRRAQLHSTKAGLSTAGGQTSLKTIFDEPDFALAFFLLSVLGEGTFLNLLRFLEEHAPDEATRTLARLTAQDESRHVAFGMAHLGRHLKHDPALKARLIAAARDRHEALANTAGLNEEVFDALVLLAAGSWQPDAIGQGFTKVSELNKNMHEGRVRRLLKLGFGNVSAEEVSSLHTRNFM